MKKRLEKIAIIGLGLIGGSLGMVLRKKGVAGTIIGVGRSKGKLKRAQALGAIDTATTDLKRIEGATLLIVATPVSLIPYFVRRSIPYLSAGAVITDVGSTKAKLIREIRAFLPRHLDFIGGHPLAGSEASGIENASRKLFQGTYCLLTPDAACRAPNLRLIKQIWQEAGAKVLIIKPEEHDRLLALTSHFPHLLVDALVDCLADFPQRNLSPFIARGFRDTTRIASSSPFLWRDIFLHNREALLKMTKIFLRHLQKLEEYIKKEKGQALLAALSRIKKKRDSLA